MTTPISAKQERAAFDAWCASNNPIYYPSDDGMGNRRDWKVWQARAALAPLCQHGPACPECETIEPTIQEKNKDLYARWWARDPTLWREKAGNSCPPPKWIMVSARLPERDATVLITGYACGVPDNGRFTAVASYQGMGRFFGVEDGQEYHPSTHWQPLPALPGNAG